MVTGSVTSVDENKLDNPTEAAKLLMEKGASNAAMTWKRS